MTENEELEPGKKTWQTGDDQPVIEPEIVEQEISKEKHGEMSLEKQFQHLIGGPPFPLTAAKLEHIVQRFDILGPMQLGAFYPVRLHKECALLLPHPIYGFDDWRFADLLSTWNRNFMFFKCRALGEVLACFEMAQQNYETRRRNDVDDHKKKQ